MGATMNIENNVLSDNEKIIFLLRKLYSDNGYSPYKMSKFEEYDFYSKNKDFLVSDNVITFTDTTGKLLALKPDVTLSIIKNNADCPNDLNKLYYNENVYRVSNSNNSFKEIMQTGIECFGPVDDDCIISVINLAAESLNKISNDFFLFISDLDIVDELIELSGANEQAKSELYSSLTSKNSNELYSISIARSLNTYYIDKLSSLLNIRCTALNLEDELKKVFDELTPKTRKFIDFVKSISNSLFSDKIIIDFTITGDINYYNSIIFKGYISGIPNAVLSGGCYDRLMIKMNRKSRAIGFAIYLDELERYNPLSSSDISKDDNCFINIALPKGRLGSKVYDLLAEAGYDCPSILKKNRKLIFQNDEKRIRYFWVKPSDVAIYVERGAADIGVAGKDILLEYNPDVFELLNLNIGKCKMAVAAPSNYIDNSSKTLRVATKFSNIASDYYLSKGRDIDIIHLNGSIEIAPILGLSDVIVDIVETGKTLQENDLRVIEDITDISARLISNKSSYKFKNELIDSLVNKLSEIVKEN